MQVAAGQNRTRHTDTYGDYAALSRSEREEVDYRVVVREVADSGIAIIAPHGGGIERGTSRIARELAGESLHLYLFEGLKARGNFNALHITSRRFDEPRCLGLIAGVDTVVTVHGCAGLNEHVCIGGLHEDLKQHIAAALRAIDVDARLDGHNFPGLDRDNICNRGRSGRGVQLEFSTGIRRRMQYGTLAYAIRSALVEV